MAGVGGNLSNRDFDYFMMWNVDSLKDFLRKYGLSVSGNIKDLAAKAYSAWDMQLPLKKTHDEVNANLFLICG